MSSRNQKRYSVYYIVFCVRISVVEQEGEKSAYFFPTCPKRNAFGKMIGYAFGKGVRVVLRVFIEYKVKEEQREAYLQEMARIPAEVAKRGGRNYRFYEGTDQPCLFVESFEVADERAYRAIKTWRTGDQRFATFLVGGLEKMHVWAFRPVSLGRS